MPEIEIKIGGRPFDVSCQPGEEQYLQAAAALLDAEATVLTDQIGRIPEPRMLLMAGLMLADKTAALEEKVKTLGVQIQTLDTELTAFKNAPKPEPEKVQVAVIPTEVTDTMAELAARAESLAANVEEKARG